MQQQTANRHKWINGKHVNLYLHEIIRADPFFPDFLYFVYQYINILKNVNTLRSKIAHEQARKTVFNLLITSHILAG